MPTKPADLAHQLERTLAPLYLISGDETLLVEEACDAVLEAARRAGFSERSVLHAEAGFEWHDVLQDAASLSLFAERRIIDIRVPGGRFDRDAQDVLRSYAETPPPDTLLLVRAPRLEPRQRNSAWMKTLDRVGVVVLVWPVGPRELPRWLEGRLHRAGLRLEREAVALLAERVEGNLLAAAQEIEKLKLAELPSPIGAAELQRSLGDAAHYDTFELVDAVLAGDARRVSRMVVNLRQEGVALFAVLGAFTSQLRRIAAGGRLPPQRQRLVRAFLERNGSAAGVGRILAECALVDAQGKGQLPGDAWDSLEDLLLRLSGVRGLPLALRLPR